MSSQSPGDLTPESSSPTDVAPLGRSGEKPEHEKTASEDGKGPWEAIAADPQFKKLIADKLRFIIPCTIFFVLYYFALPILVGWFPELMKKEVLGHINLAYLFALSQFFVAWGLAWMYVRTAARWDKASDALLAKFKR